MKKRGLLFVLLGCSLLLASFSFGVVVDTGGLPPLPRCPEGEERQTILVKDIFDMPLYTETGVCAPASAPSQDVRTIISSQNWVLIILSLLVIFLLMQYLRQGKVNMRKH